MAGNKLRGEIISLVSKVTKSDIKRNSTKRQDVSVSFIEGIDVDSLMALEIVAALEKRYKIEISEEDLSKLGSIDSIVVLIEKLVAGKHLHRKAGENIITKPVVKETRKIKISSKKHKR